MTPKTTRSAAYVTRQLRGMVFTLLGRLALDAPDFTRPEQAGPEAQRAHGLLQFALQLQIEALDLQIGICRVDGAGLGQLKAGNDGADVVGGQRRQRRRRHQRRSAATAADLLVRRFAA